MFMFTYIWVCVCRWICLCLYVLLFVTHNSIALYWFWGLENPGQRLFRLILILPIYKCHLCAMALRFAWQSMQTESMYVLYKCTWITIHGKEHQPHSMHIFLHLPFRFVCLFQTNTLDVEYISLISYNNRNVTTFFPILYVLTLVNSMRFCI